MNKKERVRNAIQGREVDRIPSGFSLHFDPNLSEVQEITKTHLDFFEATDSDISKIMNEQLVPRIPQLDAPEDWNRIEAFDRSTPFMAKQLEIVREIRDAVGPEEYLMVTLHGICASAIHPSEYLFGYEGVREQFVKHIRENPEPVVGALERITQGMIDFGRACVELGVDAIYYAALGGETRFFNDEEFERYIRKYDLEMLQAFSQEKVDVFLHICKHGLNLCRYKGYEDYCDVVNWGVYENNVPLSEGRHYLGDQRCIMGGLPNHEGIVISGDEDEIRACLEKVIEEAGHRSFILGADCTLPTDTDPAQIRRINEVLKTL